MENPYDWTRQRMLTEIESLNGQVAKLELAAMEHEKINKKYKILEKSLMGINLHAIKSLQAVS